ncbi:helix-turn-helix domain-containing protein [Methylocapsa palsarum]|uniref:DNA binding domain-containing protein, excisionase family n=1 Tax=Methylocapsa palsarum TaxID=1612308 RepID=A0A1I4CFZ0_9HYPH|nr:helix-turn-helix domain-containing protein [Methylocapsa palsarum]SFK79199.1 hypothetical protein SAMN05444581_12123 [Methylocapsa palsarum]
MSDIECNLSYGIDAFVKIAGIGRTTVFQEIAEGRLKARKIGRRTIILKDDAIAWLTSLPASRPRNSEAV